MAAATEASTNPFKQQGQSIADDDDASAAVHNSLQRTNSSNPFLQDMMDLIEPPHRRRQQQQSSSSTEDVSVFFPPTNDQDQLIDIPITDDTAGTAIDKPAIKPRSSAPVASSSSLKATIGRALSLPIAAAIAAGDRVINTSRRQSSKKQPRFTTSSSSSSSNPFTRQLSAQPPSQQEPSHLVTIDSSPTTSGIQLPQLVGEYAQRLPEISAPTGRLLRILLAICTAINFGTVGTLMASGNVYAGSDSQSHAWLVPALTAALMFLAMLSAHTGCSAWLMHRYFQCMMELQQRVVVHFERLLFDAALLALVGSSMLALGVGSTVLGTGNADSFITAVLVLTADGVLAGICQGMSNAVYCLMLSTQTASNLSSAAAPAANSANNPGTTADSNEAESEHRFTLSMSRSVHYMFTANYTLWPAILTTVMWLMGTVVTVSPAQTAYTTVLCAVLFGLATAGLLCSAVMWFMRSSFKLAACATAEIIPMQSLAGNYATAGTQQHWSSAKTASSAPSFLPLLSQSLRRAFGSGNALLSILALYSLFIPLHAFSVYLPAFASHSMHLQGGSVPVVWGTIALLAAILASLVVSQRRRRFQLASMRRLQQLNRTDGLLTIRSVFLAALLLMCIYWALGILSTLVGMFIVPNGGNVVFSLFAVLISLTTLLISAAWLTGWLLADECNYFCQLWRVQHLTGSKNTPSQPAQSPANLLDGDGLAEAALSADRSTIEKALADAVVWQSSMQLFLRVFIAFCLSGAVMALAMAGSDFATLELHRQGRWQLGMADWQRGQRTLLPNLPRPGAADNAQGFPGGSSRPNGTVWWRRRKRSLQESASVNDASGYQDGDDYKRLLQLASDSTGGNYSLAVVFICLHIPLFIMSLFLLSATNSKRLKLKLQRIEMQRARDNFRLQQRSTTAANLFST